MICIVATNHKDPKYEKMLKDAVQYAAQGSVAVFMEGVSADSTKAKQFIKEAFGVTNGLIFGCEDDILNAINGILFHLGYCREPGMQQDCRMGKVQTAYDIATIDELYNVWNKIKSRFSLSKYLEPLIDKVRNNQMTLTDFVNQVNNSSAIISSNEWIDIYKELFKTLRENISNSFSSNQISPLYDNKVDVYVNSPENANQDYIVHEINERLREQFIAQNIINTIKSYNLQNKDILVFIGAAHADTIKARLQQEFPTLPTLIG